MRFREVPAPVLVAVGVVVLTLVSAVGTSAVQVSVGWPPGSVWVSIDPPPLCTAEDAALDPPPEHCPRDLRPSPSVFGSIAAGGVGVVMLVIVALVVFAVGVTIAGIEVRMRRRVRGEGSHGAPVDAERDTSLDGATVRRAVRRALDQLRRPADGDPGDAVIAAWLTLEQAAAAAGSGRAAHQTPTEFASAVLAGHQLDAASLDRLRVLYLRARFATGSVHQPVTTADVEAAADALETLVDGSVPASPVLQRSIP
jgi:hypothetical protein